MKTIIKTLALFMAFSFVTTGCQKETFTDTGDAIGDVASTQVVTFTVNGETSLRVITSEEDWLSFLNWMVALAKEGNKVSFYRGAYKIRGIQKDVITYVTKSHDDAVSWANEMSNAGYEVSIDYNKETGVYTCIAFK